MLIMREEILDLIYDKTGEYVSGEMISRRFNVSRTSVWKHIEGLRSEGYIIDSQPKHGYRFIKAPDLLLPREINRELDTRIFGKGRIVYLEKVNSTNDIAKELAAKGAEEGTIVLAEKQLRGRGRMGRWWDSPFGKGIYVSIILKPGIMPQDAPKITMVFGVAAVRAIEKVTSLKAGIKWPNDLLINGKKVGGILTEMSTEMDGIEYIVVGIGINVNNSLSSFPDEIKKTASSLKIELNRPVSRIVFFGRLLEQMEDYYRTFVGGNFSSVLNEWRKLTVTLGNRVESATREGKIYGEAIDIDPDGALMVKDEKGVIHRIISGDIASPESMGDS